MKQLEKIMFKNQLRLLFLIIFLFSASTVFAQNEVVVIPLFGKEATGDATIYDILKGKTFSNSSATGLSGKRPPAPVEAIGPGDSFDGVTWPNPRLKAGTHVVTDNLTGLMWQKSVSRA